MRRSPSQPRADRPQSPPDLLAMEGVAMVKTVEPRSDLPLAPDFVRTVTNRSSRETAQ